MTWSAATASTAKTAIFPTPECYRGHRLLLLRYMRALLRLKHYESNVHDWVREVRCHVNEKQSIVGFRMHEKKAEWFAQHFMHQVHKWYTRTFGMNGPLLSLMTEPMGSKTQQLFSAVVYGMGSRPVKMFSLGRMECLAFELVVEARQVLLMFQIRN